MRKGDRFAERALDAYEEKHGEQSTACKLAFFAGYSSALDRAIEVMSGKKGKKK